MFIFFEKLVVWQLSRAFASEIYRVTKKIPQEEKFGITSQIRRSALSIPTNIAEGSARISGKEKARFTEVAYGSMIEKLNHINNCRRFKLFTRRKIDRITSKNR